MDNLHYVLMRLPRFAVCEALWDAFFDSVYPIYPLIDLARLQTWGTKFWERYDSAKDFNTMRSLISKDPGMICVFLAVMCSGAVTVAQGAWAYPPLRTENRDSVILYFKISARMALDASSFDVHPSLCTIIASLLLDLVFGSQVESSGHRSYIKAMTAAAQRIRLHDPNNVLNPSLAIQQLCQRLWDHIRWLDAQSCIATGAASDEHFQEELIGDKHRQPPAISDSNGDIPLLLSYARAEVAVLEHRLIGNVRGTVLDGPDTRPYDGSQLERVKTVLHDIKTQMGQLPDWDDLDTVKVDVKWAKDVIDILCLEVAVLDLVPTGRQSLDSKSLKDWTM